MSAEPETPPGSPHRAWLEIDHGAIRHNLARLRELAGGDRQVIAVVKANAYGHGAVAVARTLLGAGVERLAVATVGECRLIVSWNFKHIVSFQKIPLYNGVNLSHGFGSIAIHSPLEVIENEDQDF